MKEIIISTQNTLIKEIIRLKKENYRKKTDIVVIEGQKEVETAKLSNISFEKVVVCEDYNLDKNIISNIDNKKIFNISKNLFKKVSERENPDGIIVLAKINEKKINEVEINENLLVLAIEGIEKPGNLGAMARSADAVGASAIFVLDSNISIYNRNVIRSSRGAIFSLPVITTTLNEFVNWAKKNQIRIFTASPHESEDYTTFNYQRKCAFLLGNEHIGLSNKALKIANNKIKIPMKGKIDSLNVSVTAALLLYESLRQRMNN